MPRSRITFLVGLAFAVVGLVGFVVFGWRFGGPADPVAVVFAIVAVIAAAVMTVRRLRADD